MGYCNYLSVENCVYSCKYEHIYHNILNYKNQINMQIYKYKN